MGILDKKMMDYAKKHNVALATASNGSIPKYPWGGTTTDRRVLIVTGAQGYVDSPDTRQAAWIHAYIANAEISRRVIGTTTDWSSRKLIFSDYRVKRATRRAIREVSSK